MMTITSFDLQKALEAKDRNRVIELSMPKIEMAVSKLFSIDPSITQDDLIQCAVEASMHALERFDSTDPDRWRAYVYQTAKNAALKATRKAVRRGPPWSLDKQTMVGEDRDGYDLYEYLTNGVDIHEDVANDMMLDLVLNEPSLTQRERAAILKRILGINLGEHIHSSKRGTRKLREAWHGREYTEVVG